MGYSAVRERKTSIIDLKPNLRHFKNSEKKKKCYDDTVYNGWAMECLMDMW